LLWTSGNPDPLWAMAESIRRGAEMLRELEQRAPPEESASRLELRVSEYQLDLPVNPDRLELREITGAAEISAVESLFAAGDAGR
jgi:hypothetical protein